MDILTAKFQKRFWAKVDRTGGWDACWLWTGSKSRGYGYIRIGERSCQAHRISYLLHYDEIPESMHVLHRCDNPACINPTHLFVGTAADNMRDRNAKGRAASKKGPLNGRWKGGISKTYQKSA